MKIGIAKDDLGICLTGKFEPVEKQDAKVDGVVIIRGKEYYVPDDYDFSHPSALFVEKKIKKEK